MGLGRNKLSIRQKNSGVFETRKNGMEISCERFFRKFRKLLNFRNANIQRKSSEIPGTKSNGTEIWINLAKLSSISEISRKNGKWHFIHHWKFTEIQIGIFVNGNRPSVEEVRNDWDSKGRLFKQTLVEA